MNRLAMGLIGMMLGLATAAQAAAPACTRPDPEPFVPDGSFADRSQMAAARDAVQRFVTALQDQRACLQHQLDAAGATVGPEQKQVWRSDLLDSLNRERLLQQTLADETSKLSARH